MSRPSFLSEDGQLTGNRRQIAVKPVASRLGRLHVVGQSELRGDYGERNSKVL
jgi:hypothetical protein